MDNLNRQCLVGQRARLLQDAHNLLRPETMESLFVLWRVTGKLHFREWAWAIFRAFQMHARVESGGYANLDSCLEVGDYKLSFSANFSAS